MSEPEATSASEGRRAGRKAYVSMAVVVAAAGAAILLRPAWLYDWIKVLHVVAVISWMVGLFYLPRIFVYHADTEPDSDTSLTFVVMERRLLKVIMAPAMMISWGAGLYLAWQGFAFAGTWLWIKILAVIGLTGFHVYLTRAARRFAAGKNRVTARRWRMLNEIPTVMMIVAIIMVIVKPFS